MVVASTKQDPMYITVFSIVLLNYSIATVKQACALCASHLLYQFQNFVAVCVDCFKCWSPVQGVWVIFTENIKA
jgi:hypothetical protein